MNCSQISKDTSFKDNNVESSTSSVYRHQRGEGGLVTSVRSSANFFCLKETDRLFSCYFFLHSPPEAPRFSTQILFYTMAIPTLKWSARKGAPKTTGDTPIYSDNEGPNPNANDTPTVFTIKHYKWLLQYQQLVQFYLVRGHTYLTRHNADNSLAERASYQRTKMGIILK
jgi:hypothetical protein